MLSDNEKKCNHCHGECEDEDLLELEKHTIRNHTFFKTVFSILQHTGEDLLSVMRYLVVGAFIASVVQVLLPRNAMMIFSSNKLLSIIVLMLFAYLIS